MDSSVGVLLSTVGVDDDGSLGELSNLLDEINDAVWCAAVGTDSLNLTFLVFFLDELDEFLNRLLEVVVKLAWVYSSHADGDGGLSLGVLLQELEDSLDLLKAWKTLDHEDVRLGLVGEDLESSSVPVGELGDCEGLTVSSIVLVSWTQAVWSNGSTDERHGILLEALGISSTIKDELDTLLLEIFSFLDGLKAKSQFGHDELVVELVGGALDNVGTLFEVGLVHVLNESWIL